MLFVTCKILGITHFGRDADMKECRQKNFNSITGTEDMVQCFYCGLKLRSWDVFDNPWVEHARHGKNCPHVSNVKGDQIYKQLKQVKYKVLF